jgi:glutamate synthase (NADPH/NADH) small chain
MACAQQLARAGHSVTLYERADRLGGLLRYGIPDFKLEKWQVERRVEQMKAEGVEIVTNCRVGFDIHADQLRAKHDAIVLTVGATKPRDLPVPGRELKGIHFAMEFLPQQNKRNAGDTVAPEVAITASGKRVVILGGGDTGSDCLGTSNRQGASVVYQYELLPMPPERRTAAMPWPDWPMILRTSTSHEEGVTRDWSINTKYFSGHGDVVKKLHGVRLNWKQDGGRMLMEEVPGSEFELECDLVLLALGFLGPEPDGIVSELGLKLDQRGNIACDNYHSSVPGVFAAGDARRGQSLVVWAIWEGRECARAVDAYLMGESFLPASPEL